MKLPESFRISLVYSYLQIICYILKYPTERAVEEVRSVGKGWLAMNIFIFALNLLSLIVLLFLLLIVFSFLYL
jgi:hypothetical protein